MKFAKTVLTAAAMALACGFAYGADDDKQSKGFNELDKNKDGKLSRTEAAGNKTLIGKWKELDTDNDGSLSRAEYLKEMAKQDASKVKERVSKTVDSVKNRNSGDAATGGTAKSQSK